MIDKQPRIALLIDADNSPSSKIDVILAELAKVGVTNIRRAYGNWKKSGLRGWENVLHEYAIRPIQQFDYSKGKNATDMGMVIDAMDLLYTDRPDAYGLVSSDSDFTPLVLHLKAKGAVVYGFGAKKTPMPFVNACSRFLYLEHLGRDDVEIDDDLAPPPAPASVSRARRGGRGGRSARVGVPGTAPKSMPAPVSVPVPMPMPTPMPLGRGDAVARGRSRAAPVPAVPAWIDEATEVEAASDDRPIATGPIDDIASVAAPAPAGAPPAPDEAKPAKRPRRSRAGATVAPPTIEAEGAPPADAPSLEAGPAEPPPAPAAKKRSRSRAKAAPPVAAAELAEAVGQLLQAPPDRLGETRPEAAAEGPAEGPSTGLPAAALEADADAPGLWVDDDGFDPYGDHVPALDEGADAADAADAPDAPDARPAGRSEAPARGAAARVDTRALRRDARLVTLLRNAVASAAGEDGWSALGAVGQHIGNQASFDPRNYGYRKLLDLVEATQLFELARRGSQVVLRDRRRPSRG